MPLGSFYATGTNVSMILIKLIRVRKSWRDLARQESRRKSASALTYHEILGRAEMNLRPQWTGVVTRYGRARRHRRLNIGRRSILSLCTRYQGGKRQKESVCHHIELRKRENWAVECRLDIAARPSIFLSTLQRWRGQDEHGAKVFTPVCVTGTSYARLEGRVGRAVLGVLNPNLDFAPSPQTRLDPQLLARYIVHGPSTPHAALAADCTWRLKGDEVECLLAAASFITVCFGVQSRLGNWPRPPLPRNMPGPSLDAEPRLDDGMPNCPYASC